MIRRFATTLTAAFLMTTAIAAAQEEPPAMTPEQMAEMEVYMKAGTPNEAHQALAASAGSYELIIKSWTEPGGEPMESTGTAT